jgi:hypothetical protein
MHHGREIKKRNKQLLSTKALFNFTDRGTTLSNRSALPLRVKRCRVRAIREEGPKIKKMVKRKLSGDGNHSCLLLSDANSVICWQAQI